MKIVQLCPGSGDNYYCGNCHRDSELAKAMHRLGHEVFLVPMYLPPAFDTLSLNKSPLFFGGVNVYLQQKSALFRNTPRWIDKIFDSPKLLALASKKAGTTNAKELGETMLSMLAGQNGKQAKELNRLLDWLALPENEADIICLSNILLSGLAENLRQRLGKPVFCLLQDEDEFLNELQNQHRRDALRSIQNCCRNIDGFIASSQFYAESSCKLFGIDKGNIHVVYNGISLDEIKISKNFDQPPAIGFLSRMCVDKGLDLLIDAFIELKRTKFTDLKLKIIGGSIAADNQFIKSITRKLKNAGIAESVEFINDFTPAAKADFFKNISVLSVPEKKPVSNALYVLESFANSTPVVQPDHGIFPEILTRTGGGLLFEPNNTSDLIRQLTKVLENTEYNQQLGQQGRHQIANYFNIENTAKDIVDLYSKISHHRCPNNSKHSL